MITTDMSLGQIVDRIPAGARTGRSPAWTSAAEASRPSAARAASTACPPRR